MSSTEEPLPVLVRREQRVLVVEMNTPSRRNAMTRAAGDLIAAALDTLDADDTLSVGVLTGAGDTFCAGMDLRRFAAGELPAVPGRGFGGLTLRPPVKPLVAAVEGYALGGGFELVLACDLVVAGRSARFGLPEVTRGLVARSGGLVRLPRLIPRMIATELILTGDSLSAGRSAALGLVNRVVDDGTALAEALALARRIAANAPLALVASKRVITESWDWSTSEWSDRQMPITAPVFTSEDAREGALAFAERRTPTWRGR